MRTSERKEHGGEIYNQEKSSNTESNTLTKTYSKHGEQIPEQSPNRVDLRLASRTGKNPLKHIVPSRRHLHRIMHTVILPKVRKEPRQFPIHDTSNRRTFHDDILGNKVGMSESYSRFLGQLREDRFRPDPSTIVRDELFESGERFLWSESVWPESIVQGPPVTEPIVFVGDVMVSMRARKALSCSAMWSSSAGDMVSTTSRKATPGQRSMAIYWQPGARVSSMRRGG